MAINWLIFKNERCVPLAAQLNTRLVRICIFFGYPLMVGFSRKAVVRAVCRNTYFRQMPATTQPITSFSQPVKIKQSKKLKQSNLMHSDAKLTWGRSYYCKAVSTY